MIIKTKTSRGMGTLRAKIGQKLKCAKSNIDLLSPIHISDNLDPQKTRNKNLSFRCLRFGGKGNKAHFYILSMFDKRSIESLNRKQGLESRATGSLLILLDGISVVLLF